MLPAPPFPTSSLPLPLLSTCAVLSAVPGRHVEGVGPGPLTHLPLLSTCAVLSASLDGTVRAWDLVRYRCFRTMTPPTAGAQFASLAVDPGGEVCVLRCARCDVHDAQAAVRAAAPWGKGA